MRLLTELLVDKNGDPLLEALRERNRQQGSPWALGHPLPLPEVDYSLSVDPDEVMVGATWPPARFDHRVERLDRFHDWGRGDLSYLIDPEMMRVAGVAPTNIFRRVAKFVADLLVMERPRLAGEDGDDWLMKLLTVAHTAISDTIKYGAAFIVAAPTLQWFRVVDARYVLARSDGGWVIGEPKVSKGMQTQTPDLKQIVNIDPSGQATLTLYRDSRDRFGVGPAGNPRGGLAEEITTPAQAGTVTVCPIVCLPEVADYWGTSWFEDLATIVVQKTRRMAANALVLDANSHPLLFLKGVADNYTRAANVPRSRANHGDPASPAEIKAEGDILSQLRHGTPILLRDGIEGAEYVTWTGNLEASMTALDKIAMDLRLMSGLPAAMESDQAIPSGVSLKRMFWQLYASVSPIYHGVHDALTMALTAYAGKELDWENVLEQVDNQPVMTAVEEVEDEETARRGETEEEDTDA